jgi:hypothetical protein
MIAARWRSFLKFGYLLLGQLFASEVYFCQLAKTLERASFGNIARVSFQKFPILFCIESNLSSKYVKQNRKNYSFKPQK